MKKQIKLPPNYLEIIEKNLPITHFKTVWEYNRRLLEQFLDDQLLDSREEGEIMNLCEGSKRKAKALMKEIDTAQYLTALKIMTKPFIVEVNYRSYSGNPCSKRIRVKAVDEYQATDIANAKVRKLKNCFAIDGGNVIPDE